MDGINGINDIIVNITVLALPVLIAITFHEAAHGWVAWKLGDDTAKRLGRVSFNPLRHIDPIGTILVPLLFFITPPHFLFGWAKPVPVDFRRLRNPRWGSVLVALAGPGVNILLAFVSGLLLNSLVLLPPVVHDWTLQNLVRSIELNCFLAGFNMLPILPLDGGRVLAGLLPWRLRQVFSRTERFGMLIVLGLMAIVPMLAAQAGYLFNPLFDLLAGPIDRLIHLILSVTLFTDG